MTWLIALLGARLLTVEPAVPCPPCGEPRGRMEKPEPPQEAEPEPTLELGGAMRFNLQYKSWVRGNPELPRNVDLDFEFDTFRLNVDGSYGALVFSTEYRFYTGYHMLHHGWVGYRFSEELSMEVGVHQVPFGPLPYASHNWFFQLPYYVGLEDDYDAGIKLRWASDRWTMQGAFYKNDEGSYTGESLSSARYSYDVVPATVEELGYAGLEEDRFNEELNQVNGRLTRRWELSAEGEVEAGVSGQWGQLHNVSTDELGTRWAAGVHVEATHGRWHVVTEAIRYEQSPRNPTGTDARFVVMGAYDAPYKVAARADLYVVGLAYTIPVAWGPVSRIQLYDDFTYMSKDEPSFEDSVQHVLGGSVSAGPLHVYADLASGRNHPWLGPDYGAALAEGRTANAWHTRLNLNMGYYF